MERNHSGGNNPDPENTGDDQETCNSEGSEDSEATEAEEAWIQESAESRAKRELEESVDSAIKAALLALQQSSRESGAKASVSDLVRLLQLRKELDAERPRKITARWVGECRNSTEK